MGETGVVTDQQDMAATVPVAAQREAAHIGRTPDKFEKAVIHTMVPTFQVVPLATIVCIVRINAIRSGGMITIGQCPDNYGGTTNKDSRSTS